MAFDLVIKNGRVVTAAASFNADVAVQGERIAAVGQNLSGTREIDASGKLVTPGAVDVHVHMQMTLPGNITSSDTFFTGTRAAAFGGTTAIVDFAECLPAERMVDAVARRCREADPQVVVDYGLHMTIGPSEIAKLDQVRDAYMVGCASFKLYMAYGFYLDDGQLLRALQAIKKAGGLPVIHAENWKVIGALIEQNLAAGRTTPEWHPRSRPALTEGESVGRAIDIATYVGTPLHVFHMGCMESVERIAAAQAKGLAITGETCPQYLMLTDDVYSREGIDGAMPVCAPPLRSQQHRGAMWRALAANHLQIVTTDHCPFVKADKRRGLDDNDFSQIPGGVPSIEVRFPLLYSFGVHGGYFNENDWVRMCCTHPAQMMGFSTKGVIAPGYDADLVVFDADEEWIISGDTLHENCDWTPYDGIEVMGRVATTISRGRVIVDDGEFAGEEGHGKFIVRRLDLTR